MEDSPVESIPLRGPVVDAADFCRPLAAVSDVALEIDFDPEAQMALVTSNTLRMQQVRQ